MLSTLITTLTPRLTFLPHGCLISNLAHALYKFPFLARYIHAVAAAPLRGPPVSLSRGKKHENAIYTRHERCANLFHFYVKY